MMNTLKKHLKTGFTLVELLVVIVVLAVIAAIVMPKFMDASSRSKESSLKSDLKILRTAIASFKTDTGYFPKTLADLAATTAPAQGYDSSGNAQSITASNWHGPYVQEVPKDPVSGNDFTYTVTSPDVGKISSSASGNGGDGTAYSTW